MNLVYKQAYSMIEPNEIEFGLTTVCLRKNIRFDNGMWTFQEALIPTEEYDAYLKLSPKKTEDNQLIIMEAIADLYDTIAKLTGGKTS